MTQQAATDTLRIDDEALDTMQVAGGGWSVVNGHGVWRDSTASFSGDSHAFTASASSGQSSVRSEVRDGQRYIYGYDVAKGQEFLKGVRSA